MFYTVAKCCTDRTCRKCNAVTNAIAVNKGTHTTLYCSNCGAYIKHASVGDKRNLFVTKVKVFDKTPIKVCTLYIESQRTMIR